MPQPYLISPRFKLPLQRSATYANRWQVMGRDLYIDIDATRRIARPPDAPPSCSDAYGVDDAATDVFHDFINGWMDNTLVLYRGIPGCHFCWPHLLGGELRSEGDEDVPTFTMGGSTRWLPTADENTANGVSLQCADEYTQALSMHEPVPIGFTIGIMAGSRHGLPLCWLNAGEIVVRGPLHVGQYFMHGITWLDARLPDFRGWPHQIDDNVLPPQRPYLPGPMGVIVAWWETAQFWVTEVAKYDGLLQVAAPRRQAAARARRAAQGPAAGTAPP